VTSVTTVIAVLAALVAALGLMSLARFVAKLRSADPTMWEGAIRRFEKADHRSPPPEGVIVFTGSSSIRFWKSLKEDMAPLLVLNRGFGGSQIHQVTHYVDRIVLPYKPGAVVFYAGENDMAGLFLSRKRTPVEIRDAYQRFCEKIHAALPDVPIYYISTKPPKRRLSLWPAMQEANRLVRECCAFDKRLHYIDIVPAMLDAQGNPRRDVFKWDGIHLNKKGYAIWKSVVRPVLLEAFLERSEPATGDLRPPAA
jgi:lysophospholipase L1-like esterase